MVSARFLGTVGSTLGFCPSGSGVDLRFKSSYETVSKIRILGNSEERKFEFSGNFIVQQSPRLENTNFTYMTVEEENHLSVLEE